MFSPKLYKVRKIPAKQILDANKTITINNELFAVSQQDCMIFRIIRNVIQKEEKFISQIIFVDCNGSKGRKEEIEDMVINGFTVNGVHFSVSERSASMTRNAILGFVESSIIDIVDAHITMDLDIGETVLAKWSAYRGLMFSSCHCLEGWRPKTIVVDDYETVLKNQKLKWLCEDNREYIDRETGEQKIWRTHGIEEGFKDVEINVFDGFGLIHPVLAEEIRSIVKIEENATTFMLRAPFIKGLVSSVDYTSYYIDNGVEFITDIFGVYHSVAEPMIILTKSMYKGYKYFKKNNDLTDWCNYWEKFDKYNHCWGVPKWNFTKEREPVYTKANYQILQDLDIPFDEFRMLAEKSLKWATDVVNEDEIATKCFLGIKDEECEPLNNYTKAILKNPEMIKEQSVRRFLIKHTKKNIDKMKCGKIFIKACYKFLVPDIVMMLEWIGGNNQPIGCLQSDEFWANGYSSNKEYLIERNPHICSSEHLVLRNTNEEQIAKYCGHLENVCMLNGKSLSPQRMNGADWLFKNSPHIQQCMMCPT